MTEKKIIYPKERQRYFITSVLPGFIAGLLSILSFPCFESFEPLAFLGFLSWIPIYYVIHQKDRTKSLIAVTVYIVTFYSIFLQWLAIFHVAAVPALILYLILLYGSHTLIIYKILKTIELHIKIPVKIQQILLPIIAAIGFTGLEYLRTIGFLGFPYGILGYSQYSSTTFIQIASLVGVLGVSFVMHLTASLVAEYLTRMKKIPLTTPHFRNIKISVLNRFGALAVVYIAIFLFGFISLSESPSEKNIKVSLIQPWFDYNQPWTSALKNNIYKKLEQETISVALEKPDLILWPETAIMTYYEYMLGKPTEFRGAGYARMYQKFISDYSNLSPNSWFLSGTLGLVPVSNNANGTTNAQTARVAKSAKDAKTAGVEGEILKFKYYNSAIFMKPGSEVVGRDSKRKLVPFAEWFPYTDIFPFLKPILEKAQASQFTPGEKITIFEHPLFKFSVLVCYDDCFTDVCRKMSLLGSEVFVVVTNDAWSYSRTSSWLHFMFSVFRSVENRRVMLRATNGGITAIIDEKGRTQSIIESFRQDKLTDRIAAHKQKTLYSLTGDKLYQAFEILILLAFLLSLIYLGLSKQQLKS